MHRSLLLFVLVIGLGAAELRMRDGQILRGEVVGRGAVGGAQVVMVRLTGDTAVVTLKADTIATIEDGDGASAAENALPMAGHYAEIPVRGVFGKDLFAGALASGVARAHLLGLRHVVLTIDSAGWGDIDEARKAFRQLNGYQDRMTLHALVKTCRGDALAVLLACQTVHLLPGAVIGGSDGGPVEDAVMRAELAHRGGQAAATRGWPATVFEAMIDPAAGLAAWKDEVGAIHTATALPAGIPGGNVLLSSPAGATVVLEEAVLRRTRVPFVTGAADLGARLQVDGWSEGSGAPREAMLAKTAQEQRSRAATANRLQQRIERAVGRRDAADVVLKQAVRQAAEWDPAKGDYSTYSYGWGWGDSGLLTNASLAEWRIRSDYALGFLAKAVLAARDLRTYEAECEQLGIARLYDEARVTAMLEDLTAKGTFIQTMRNKREK